MPATHEVVVVRRGRFDSPPLLHAPDDTLEAWDGQAGQGDHDLIVRLYVCLLPTAHGPEADAADKAVIELYRLQLQYRCDSAAATDAERHLAHPGNGCAQRIFPGNCPVRRLGLPAGGVRALTLAQHDPITGERKTMAEPVVTPMASLLRSFQRHGQRSAFIESHRHQAGEARSHVGRAVGPVPDEQADLCGGRLIQHQPSHRSGDLAARPGTAGLRLHVVRQAPVQLALQDQFFLDRQLQRYGLQLPGAVGPVLSMAAVAAAHHPDQ